jgi:hypothetical protein
MENKKINLEKFISNYENTEIIYKNLNNVITDIKEYIEYCETLKELENNFEYNEFENKALQFAYAYTCNNLEYEIGTFKDKYKNVFNFDLDNLGKFKKLLENLETIDKELKDKFFKYTNVIPF